MSDTREIEGRIRGYQAIGKIILSMKSLASFNLQQAQESIQQIRAYESQIYHALGDFMRLFPSQVTPFRKGRKLVIVLGSDQGLCGQFNQSLLHAAQASLAASGPETGFVLAGRRLQEDFQPEPLLKLSAPSDLHSIYHRTSQILGFVHQAYVEGAFQQVEVIFNRFEGLGAYHVRTHALLPLPQGTSSRRSVLIDVAPEVLFASLLSEYFYMELHRAFLESFLSENGVRLVNMNQASHNIEQRIESLENESHFARQNELTDELNEIMGSYSVIVGEGQ
ncbi:hypothetical protein COW36_18235 [bacterium (Candidatus Blackallbacteria) CG17_big_fil_post_rev_8_21_14_2_50_48_46]|uniref:F0F1 ATP synthase subunit gamma n=1 Tax=bacterium (Candidatus Blackallbacteria) CG17_big_fil_post_rev_8_21_14_2_50_48_46 TaxID=2014261 RepID=A0A2M7G0X2_9BACT|nr:MAG: hypothetical protein COW64_00500 [bacterium (Candidatus Blackallbacteria) CG18_big_fil_WC_8_21_14_2_50_49_26]PIW15355.1 MAG: hypothetical protein COW36_18235 [bacterium (Candidatus Blackallbacteria) CG17_big_fil_post_rev_8_21_14_2_50_48_46]PIW49784.1 MAG: hypothetical protein COW20_05130 [bacterium (Candidatus Blackallbacteria) CG13_big_fil_rev_8_21_14_2_50_49_14]